MTRLLGNIGLVAIGLLLGVILTTHQHERYRQNQVDSTVQLSKASYRLGCRDFREIFMVESSLTLCRDMADAREEDLKFVIEEDEE